MSSEAVTKAGKKALNRIIIGIEFMIIFGLAGGLAVYLLGVPLTGDVRDLGTGIEAMACTTDTCLSASIIFQGCGSSRSG